MRVSCGWRRQSMVRRVVKAYTRRLGGYACQSYLEVGLWTSEIFSYFSIYLSRLKSRHQPYDILPNQNLNASNSRIYSTQLFSTPSSRIHTFSGSHLSPTTSSTSITRQDTGKAVLIHQILLFLPPRTSHGLHILLLVLS